MGRYTRIEPLTKRLRKSRPRHNSQSAVAAEVSSISDITVQEFDPREDTLFSTLANSQ